VIRPHTATIYTLSLHDALPIFFVLALDLATAGFVLGELLFGARITMLVLLEDVEALLRLVLLDLLRHRCRSSCANKKIRRKSGFAGCGHVHYLLRIYIKYCAYVNADLTPPRIGRRACR